MTDEQVLKLYEFRGTIKGKIDIAKCQLNATHDVLDADGPIVSKSYLRGLAVALGTEIAGLQRLLTEYNHLIKELTGQEPNP